MPKTDNRTVGGRFEQEFAELLAKHGFWAHVMQQNKAGQPSDIIAAKGKYHTLIDCKVISDHDGFPFSRAEENQRMAMKRFLERGGEPSWFAIRLPDGSIWMLNYLLLLKLEGIGRKNLSEQEIREKLWTQDEWLKASDEWGKDI